MMGSRVLTPHSWGDAELPGSDERAPVLPRMCRWWSSMALCSAPNPSGTLALSTCCKSPGLGAPISPTAALGPKKRGSEQGRCRPHFDHGPCWGWGLSLGPKPRLHRGTGKDEGQGPGHDSPPAMVGHGQNALK